MQALSKRVHYGKFVAEAKFLAQRKEYTKLIEQQDGDGIMALLTNQTVEEEVCCFGLITAAQSGLSAQNTAYVGDS